MIHTLYFYGDEKPAAGLSAAQIKAALDDPAGVLWIDLDACTDDEARAALATVGIRDAAANACLGPGRRPRLDDFDDHVLFTTRWPTAGADGTTAGADGTTGATTLNLAAVVGSNYLVTVHPTSCNEIDEVRQMASSDTHVLASGSAVAAALVLHKLATSLASRISEVDDALDASSRRLLGDDASESALRELFAAQRGQQALLTLVRPLVEVSALLGWDDIAAIDGTSQLYFREVSDQLTAAAERSSALADSAPLAVAGQAAVSARRVETRLRWMAVLQALLLPAILIAALFGMQLDGMPLEGSRDGWPIVLAATAVIGVMVATAMALVYRWSR